MVKVDARYYQVEAKEAVFSAFDDKGVGSALVVMPTGSGKTVTAGLFIEEGMKRGQKTLFVAHREVLIDQAYQTFEALGFNAAIEMGQQDARRQSAIIGSPDVVVGSVQSLQGDRLMSWNPEEFGQIIIDECFPAGTLVDGVPIEDVRVGDLVASYNHTSMQLEHKRVSRLFSSVPSGLVRITFSSGKSVVCTPGHPFYDARDNRYVQAVDLESGSSVIIRGCENENHQAEAVRCMRDGVSASIMELDDDSRLLRGMQGEKKTRESQDSCSSVRDMWDAEDLQGSRRAGSGQDWEGLLLCGMREVLQVKGREIEYDRPEQVACIGKNEGQKSDAQKGDKREGVEDNEGNGPQAKNTRWQRKADAGAAKGSLGSTGVASRGHRCDGSKQMARSTESLQAGYRQQDRNDCDRGGRRIAQDPRQAGPGRQEVWFSKVDWVDSVEVLEPGSNGGFGALCPGGKVYNIEVEGNHNYFANGFLVHNCHRSLSDGYTKMLNWFRKYKLIGITATPSRGDSRNLGARFETKAYEYRLRQAIKDGWLVPIRTRECRVNIDLRGVKTLGGDLSLGEVAERIGPKIEELARHFMCEIEQRPAVCFLPDVGSAMFFADTLQALGIDARYVAGQGGVFGMNKKEKNVNLQAFKDGEFQVVCCCELLIEGWDAPRVEAVGILRPTLQSYRYGQMAGRGTRPSPGTGKKDCLIIDFDWTTDKDCKDLCSTVHLFDDGSLNEEVFAVAKEIEKKIREKEEDVNPEEVIEEAEKIVRTRDRFMVRLTGKAVEYQTVEYDPVGVSKILDIKLNRKYDLDRRGTNPASEKQLALLQSMGMTAPEGLSKWGAHKMIDKIQKRKKDGLASVSQVKSLLGYGVSETIARTMNRDAARDAVRELSALRPVAQRLLF